ncbi:Eco57I restriction-modification methylase domain-containing protein [Macrococcus equi]|uniref:Eco57I restriction-modification methylase domain-containing protein n=1 Tax=Macrococcus equi TaxID=3395462 RepID=UPI0039BE343E
MSEDIYTKGNDISETALLRKDKKLLSILLKDYTTGQNIKWATDSYKQYGEGFYEDREITPNLITGWYDGFIQPRANKAKKDQQFRTKAKAEVFTPSWIVKLQVESVLNEMKDLSFDDFIHTTWLEITCGEAPYMANRYDMNSGEIISLKDRTGFIDKKFQALNNKINDKKQWMKYALKIFQSSYGYEYQGDSLLLARENLLLTFIDYHQEKFELFPEKKELLSIAEVISNNVMQMDGISFDIPFSYSTKNEVQLSLFDIDTPLEFSGREKSNIINLRQKNEKKIFGGKNMKFDVVIGNPPYQENDNGMRDEGASKNASASPIYHKFVQIGKEISTIQSLIIPARWAFGSGKGLSNFTEDMMNDKSIQYFEYFQKSSDVFENTEIKGGISIILRNNNYVGKSKIITNIQGVKSERKGHINSEGTGLFIVHNYLISIFKKVVSEDFKSIQSLVSPLKPYGLRTDLFRNPAKYDIAELANNINPEFPIKIYGLSNNKRVVKYSKYIDSFKDNEDSINKWKVFSAYAYGSGTFGEKMGDIIIAEPNSICTETFLRFGAFEKQQTAENFKKYMKTKFFRTMVGVLKVTQHSTRTYKYVPWLEFENDSEINWSKSIKEIDQQLFKKYKLSVEEIAFIEENVKEMV